MLFFSEVSYASQLYGVARDYLVCNALPMQLPEESIEVGVFRKHLHKTDAECTVNRTHLNQNRMQRGGFGLNFSYIVFGAPIAARPT